MKAAQMRKITQLANTEHLLCAKRETRIISFILTTASGLISMLQVRKLKIGEIMLATLDLAAGKHLNAAPLDSRALT